MTWFPDNIVPREQRYNAANRRFLAEKTRAEKAEREHQRSRRRAAEERAARHAAKLAGTQTKAGTEATTGDGA